VIGAFAPAASVRLGLLVLDREHRRRGRLRSLASKLRATARRGSSHWMPTAAALRSHSSCLIRRTVAMVRQLPEPSAARLAGPGSPDRQSGTRAVLGGSLGIDPLRDTV
jgi:hypothetical protein